MDAKKTRDEVSATPEIFEYIRRNRNGKKCKVGIVVGQFVDKKIYVGWSKCNWDAGDEFNFGDGWKIATDRLGGISDLIKTPTPADIRKQLRKFSSRCVRYFKGATELHMPG